MREALGSCLAFEDLARVSAAGGTAALGDLDRELNLLGEGACASSMGRALAAACARFDLSPFWFRSRIAALRDDAALATVGTREELETQARRLAHPTGRCLLRILGLDDERGQVLADALATGVQLTRWLEHLAADWNAGRLRLPMDELVRAGVDPTQLRSGTPADGLRPVVARGVAAARAQLAKGWPLTRALGPWRGRRLAIYLRWHAATLSAIEVADHDIWARPPRAGLLRALACVTAGSAAPEAPF